MIECVVLDEEAAVPLPIMFCMVGAALIFVGILEYLKRRRETAVAPARG